MNELVQTIVQWLDLDLTAVDGTNTLHVLAATKVIETKRTVLSTYIELHGILACRILKDEAKAHVWKTVSPNYRLSMSIMP